MIKSNNKMIAIFLGWVEQTDPSRKWLGSFKTEDGIIHKNTNKEPLLFHCDWNWLMLVVEKIFNTDVYYKEFIDYNSSIVSDGQIRLSYKIKDVYLQCIEFVKWYNNK